MAKRARNGRSYRWLAKNVPVNFCYTKNVTMEALISELMKEGYLKTPNIIDAFRSIQREDFTPESELDRAGENFPLPIGYGQTISQPLTVALMLELLQPKPGEQALDIGAGSGWTVALLAHLVGKKGKVVAMERIPQLKRFAEQNLKKYHLPNVTLLQGDGSLGAPAYAPFHVIHVAAAPKEGIPKALKEQLAVGGRLVIPVGEGVQTIILLTKKGPNDFVEERFEGFSFVPMIEGPIA